MKLLSGKKTALLFALLFSSASVTTTAHAQSFGSGLEFHEEAQSVPAIKKALPNQFQTGNAANFPGITDPNMPQMANVMEQIQQFQQEAETTKATAAGIQQNMQQLQALSSSRPSGRQQFVTAAPAQTQSPQLSETNTAAASPIPTKTSQALPIYDPPPPVEAKSEIPPHNMATPMRLADAAATADPFQKANQTMQQYGNFNKQMNAQINESIKSNKEINTKIDEIRNRVQQQQDDINGRSPSQTQANGALPFPGAPEYNSAGNGQNGTPAQNAPNAPMGSGGVHPLAPTTASAGQQQMPMPAQPQMDVGDEAFQSAASSLLPMTPTQIHRLKQMFLATQAAASAPADTPPKPTATSMYVNLAPGSTPPVIRLEEGFVSSLVFLDASGAPWPIEAYDLGNPKAFNISWDKKDNTLMIQANTLFTYGNLAVKLRDLNTPVMLTLLPGQKVVDYRVDLRIQGYGPNARHLPISDGVPFAEDRDLLSVLDGVPPAGAVQLKVDGGEGNAWLSNGKLYLRTHDTVLSPAWIATLSSADGMNAYEMASTPLILVSENGKPLHLRIEGY